MELILSATLWIVLSVLNALVAQRRQNNIWGAFLLSLVLSPVLVYLYMLATPAPVEEERSRALIRAILNQ